MADDLQANLDSYRIQLQQVEAALLAEPENPSLLKLKQDLDEIIAITVELLLPSSSINDDEDDLNTPEVSNFTFEDDDSLAKKWRVGDKCMAVWSKNNQYFEAVIDGITEGKAVVTFVGYNVTEINKLTQLKSRDEFPAPKKYLFGKGAESGSGGGLGAKGGPSSGAPFFPKNKTQWQAEKEKRKAKALKRIQRDKQIEEVKEKEKQQWKDFNRKALAKSFKGVKKGSIFATNEQASSKVGVGGSGKPMTKFQKQDRHSTLGASKMNYSTF